MKEGDRTLTETFTAFRADHYTTDTIEILAGCLGLEPRSNGFGIRHVAITPTTHYSLVGAVGIEPTTYR